MTRRSVEWLWYEPCRELRLTMPQSPVAQHQERLDRNPRDAVAFEALEEHHYLRGDWSALERLYERRLTAELRNGSADEQARILVRLGQMLERGRRDVDAALRRYREAAERAPHFRPALTALRKAHASAGRWELVLQIESDARDLAKYMNVGIQCVVGGMDFQRQLDKVVGETMHLLIATPGRLIDFINRRKIRLK